MALGEVNPNICAVCGAEWPKPHRPHGAGGNNLGLYRTRPLDRHPVAEKESYMAPTYALVEQLAQALQNTVDYAKPLVGFPCIDGWSWWDALVAYEMEIEGRSRAEAEEVVRRRNSPSPAAPAGSTMPTSSGNVTQAAIDQVDENANKAWKLVANYCLGKVRLSKPYFTTDDVWASIEEMDADVKTHDPRAMGAIMRNAAREGLITATDRTQPSTREQSHQRPIRVWRSEAGHD